MSSSGSYNNGTHSGATSSNEHSQTVVSSGPGSSSSSSQWGNNQAGNNSWSTGDKNNWSSGGSSSSNWSTGGASNSNWTSSGGSNNNGQSGGGAQNSWQQQGGQNGGSTQGTQGKIQSKNQRFSLSHVHNINQSYHFITSTNTDKKGIETEIDFDNEINHKARSLSAPSFSSQGSYSKPGLFGQSQGSWNYQSGTLVDILKYNKFLL